MLEQFILEFDILCKSHCQISNRFFDYINMLYGEEIFYFDLGRKINFYNRHNFLNKFMYLMVDPINNKVTHQSLKLLDEFNNYFNDQIINKLDMNFYKKLDKTSKNLVDIFLIKKIYQIRDYYIENKKNEKRIEKFLQDKNIIIDHKTFEILIEKMDTNIDMVFEFIKKFRQ